MDCKELGVTQTGGVGVHAVRVRECPSHSHSESFPDGPASFHPLFSSCLADNAGPDSVSPCGFAVLLPQRLGVCDETLVRNQGEERVALLSLSLLVLTLVILCCYFLV